VDLVVDASIAFKWLVKEVDSDAALQLLRSNTIVAPDILLAECRNAILTTVRRGKLSVERANSLSVISRVCKLKQCPHVCFCRTHSQLPWRSVIRFVIAFIWRLQLQPIECL